MNITNGATNPFIGVTASLVRITPLMIHGCRPTSVTTHPASIAMNPMGQHTAIARNSHLPTPPPRRRARHVAIPHHAPTASMNIPNPTITWNDTCTIATGGRGGLFNSLGPLGGATLRDRAQRIASALAGHCPVRHAGEPLDHQTFHGAVCMA